MSMFTTAASPGTDQHNGYYHIPAGQTVTISENKQMVCFGLMTIDGTLIIEGQLILET